MALTHGMNVDAVEQIGRDLHTQASQINSVVGQVDRLVGQSQQEWKGQDASRFEAEWRGKFRQQLVNLQAQLEVLSTQARNNARDQRDTSGRLS